MEAEIRTNILKKGFIKGIIGLPANLFYGTGIPACIIVIDKENANRDSIFITVFLLSMLARDLLKTAIKTASENGIFIR